MGSNNFTSLGFPIVFTRNITIQTGKVRLDLGMKKLPCSSLQDLNDIEVKVILSFDADMTQAIINQEVELSTDFNTRGDTYHALGPRGTTTEVRSDQTIQQVFSATDLFIGGAGSLYRTKDNVDSNSYYDIPFVVNFEVPQLGFNTEGEPILTLPHMTCLAFPFQRTAGQPDGSTIGYKSTGRMSADVVFDELREGATGALNTESGLKKTSSWFRHPLASTSTNDWAWLGEYHKMISGTQVNYMVGRRHGDTVTFTSSGGAVTDLSGVNLSLLTAPNSKIKDLRMLERVPMPPATITPVDTTENSPAQFSDIFLSVDEERNVKFLFGFDCEEVYQRQYNFDSALRPEVKRMAMASMRITSMRVYRHNMDDSSDVRLLVESEDSSEIRKLIPFPEPSRIPEPGDQRQLARGAHLEETHLSILHRPDSPVTDPAYRFFSVTDYDVGFRARAGRYGYAIEIEFEDRIASFFERKIREFEQAIAAFDDYIETASKPINNNYSLGRFRQRYWDDVTTRESKEGFLEHLINTYLICLSLFHEVEREELAFSIINITHPASGNLEGLQLFRQMCGSLHTKLKRFVPRRRSREDTAEDQPSGFNPNELITFTIRRQYFRPEEIHDADCLNTFESAIESLTGKIFYAYLKEQKIAVDGLLSLDSQSNSQAATRTMPGLATLTKDAWEERTAAESEEYSVPSESVLIEGKNTQFTFSPQDKRSSFLSPIDLPLYEPDLAAIPRERWEPTFLSPAGSLQPILPSDFLQFLPAFQRDPLLAAASDSSNYTAGADDFESSQREKVEEAEATTAKTDITGFSGAENLITLLAMELNNINGEPDNQTRVGDQKLTSRKYTNESLNLNKESNIIDTMDSEQLSEIPNQIMTLLYNPPYRYRDEAGNFNRNYSNEMSFHMKYNNLQRMEILTGFGTSIKDERWRTLTDVDITNMPDVGAHFIRMRPYTNRQLGIKTNPRCAVHNEYFFIGKPTTAITDSMALVNPRIFDPIRIRNEFLWPEYLGHYAENLRLGEGEESDRLSLLNLIRINREEEANREAGESAVSSAEPAGSSVSDQGEAVSMGMGSMGATGGSNGGVTDTATTTVSMGGGMGTSTGGSMGGGTTGGGSGY